MGTCLSKILTCFKFYGPMQKLRYCVNQTLRYLFLKNYENPCASFKVICQNSKSLHFAFFSHSLEPQNFAFLRPRDKPLISLFYAFVVNTEFRFLRLFYTWNNKSVMDYDLHIYACMTVHVHVLVYKMYYRVIIVPEWDRKIL